MAALTPEEIGQIIEQFLHTVGTRQYIGARYVPIFGRKGEDSIEWDNTAPYEPLTIVLYQGDSYTSRQYVPTGIEITNQDFWAQTGNYNAQIQAYIAQVQQYDGRITQNAEDIAQNASDIANTTDLIDSVNENLTDLIDSVNDNLTDLINSVNDNLTNLIDSVKFFAQTKDPDFYPYTRCVFENTGDTYTSFQSAIIDQNEEYIYAVMPYASSDQNTTKTSTLCVISAMTGEILQRTVMDVGHGRTLSIKNNILLTNNQYAFNNNEWVAVDVSRPTAPTLVARGAFNGQHIFWTDNGAAAYNSSSNQIIFFDVEYESDNVTPRNFVNNGSFIQLPYGIRGEEQSFNFNDGVITIAGTMPETISFVDASDGALIRTIDLRSNYSYLHTAECESAFILNGNIYFTTTSTAPTKYTTGVKQLEMAVFRQNLSHQFSELYDPWLHSIYQNSRGGVQSVSGTKNAISSVTADGSSTYPFRFVEDAVRGHMARFRNKFSTHAISQLSISFNTEEYPYDITLKNIDVALAVNGFGSSHTVCGGVELLNAKVTLNRLTLNYRTSGNTDYAINCIAGVIIKLINDIFPASHSGSNAYYDVYTNNGSISFISDTCTNVDRLFANGSLNLYSGTPSYVSQNNGGWNIKTN